jgi:3-oxoacyl-[acyl-carrier protein] reductase
MREAANRMRDSGSIINLSTSVVGLNLPNYGIYAATKAAVETMTRILAKELGAKKIRVNAVAPGPTVTDLFMEGKSDELLQKLTSMIPLSRLGKPEDIAKIVAFLVSDEGSWVNGQVIRANGGLI